MVFLCKGPRGRAGTSCCWKGLLRTGAWREVAHEERVTVFRGWEGGEHSPQGNTHVGWGRGGNGEGRKEWGGFTVPSRAWGVGQEHGSFLSDIHLHPSAHLLSASRCQDNLPAQPGGGREGEGGGYGSYCLFSDGGRGPEVGLSAGVSGRASAAGAPTQRHHSPLPPPQGSGIGPRGSLRRTLIQGQRAGQPWRRRQSRKLSVALRKSSRNKGEIVYIEG